MFEGVWMCLGEKLEREERERESAQNCLENRFFLQNEGFGGIYSEKVTLQLPVYLMGLPATLLTSAILALSQFKFECIFEGLSILKLS